MNERYIALEEIGRGGFGTVTRRFDRTLRRIVAAKRTLEESPRHQELLLHEARLLAYLDHAGVVPIYDASDGEYVMKMLSGEPLNDVLRRCRKAKTRLPIAETLRLIGRLAETLANAHDKGVLHLDIKPANLMLDRYQVSIVDWGAALFYDLEPYRAYLSSGGEALDLGPPEGRARGTPTYMSHEQLTRPANTLEPSADVFAVGVLLYQMLCGKRPFGRHRTIAAEAMSRLTPPPSLTDQRLHVPVQLDVICRRMLALDPAERPQSFQEVIAELDALLGFAETFVPIEAETGQVLFREGDDGDFAYQILSGSVSIEIDTPVGTVQVARRYAGEVIGEMSLLTGDPRSASVITAEPTRLRMLRRDEIDLELAKVSPLIGHMLRSLSDRLRESEERTLRTPPDGSPST